jgi:hypothetical protein
VYLYILESKVEMPLWIEKILDVSPTSLTKKPASSLTTPGGVSSGVVGAGFAGPTPFDDESF